MINQKLIFKVCSKCEFKSDCTLKKDKPAIKCNTVRKAIRTTTGHGLKAIKTGFIL